jgi:3-oxoacyl-[acyl-carrier protein] reductase
MDLGLKEKTALIMGGSSGLGKAIARTLITEGAKVAISSRDEGKLKAAASEISASRIYPCDFSKPGQSRATIEKAISEMGQLDILVTNTGGPARGNFLDITTEQWQGDYQSVFMSAIEAMQVALPHMQKRGYGRIILITSVSAKEPLPKLTSSNGLRPGLKGLAKSISNEYASSGVTVNVLMPGYTNTERLQELKLTEEKIKQMIPIGRLAEPSELAALAAFLASPQASYITGQSIAVDGGFMRSH